VGTTLRKTPLLWVTLWLVAMALGVMALVATAGTAKAASVTPTQHDGNPTCKTLLDNPTAFEIKVDPPKSGSYGPITVNFSPDGRLVDFTSTVPVLAVFVKGGNEGGNLYDYRPAGSTGDTGLTTPTNQQISHVSFCWNEEPPPPAEALKVSKTAEATYDRKITWDLKKTVAPDSHSGTAGDSFDSTWKVTATKTATDSNYKVTGKITITNPNAQAVGFSVTDKLDDDTMAVVDCDAAAGNQDSGTVPANGSVECSYTASPTTKDATSNNVQVSSTTQGVPGASALADVIWKENVIGDDKVTLADPRFNYSQEISDTTAPPVTFPETFTCPSDPSKYIDGKHQFTETNTATLKGANTNLEKSATVTVNCTLPALTATKTANGSFDRKITWDLKKSVAPTSHSGLAGDSFNSTWNVDATKSVVEDNYKVTGKITISNDAAIDQTFSVSDKLDDGTVASVDCPSLTVPAKDSVECSYTASSKDATKNTATISAPGNADVVATANVTYTANVTGDDKVTLADPRFTYTELISDSKTKTFPETFKCPTDRAAYDSNYMLTKTFTNTATLTGPNTNLSKSATVTLNCKYPWRAETATGYGLRYKGTSNWFMVTKFTTTAPVNLIAGQHYDAGDITFTRNGTTTIKITLHDGFRFANVANNLKIQNFTTAQPPYMSPGSFKYKFNCSQASNTCTATGLPNANYYGIHVDVERKVT
jgi:hypothetical protein